MANAFSSKGVDKVTRKGDNSQANVEAQPRFKIGDSVRTVTINPIGHARLPQFARGKIGKVVQSFGANMFPDRIAHDRGEKAQFVYNVVFVAQEFWGAEANPIDTVYLSMLEDYILLAE